MDIHLKKLDINTHEIIKNSGSIELNNLLNGGFETDIITTFYGPTGSGKTNFCLLAIRPIIEENKKVIYIDTEGGFSVNRLKQIYPENPNVLENVLFLQPTNFEEQKEIFKKLNNLVDDSIGVIIVDSISMLYRLELGKNEDVFEVNRALGQQIGTLNQIVRKKQIPVIITNQVYSDFEKKDEIKMVAGNIIKYTSKCLLELQKGHSGIRQLILRKHRSIPEDQILKFKIIEKGIEKIE